MGFNHLPADVRWAIANLPEDAERGAATRFCGRHQVKDTGLVEADSVGRGATWTRRD